MKVRNANEQALPGGGSAIFAWWKSCFPPRERCFPLGKAFGEKKKDPNPRFSQVCTYVARAKREERRAGRLHSRLGEVQAQDRDHAPGG